MPATPTRFHMLNRRQWGVSAAVAGTWVVQLAGCAAWTERLPRVRPPARPAEPPPLVQRSAPAPATRPIDAPATATRSEAVAAVTSPATWAAFARLGPGVSLERATAWPWTGEGGRRSQARLLGVAEAGFRHIRLPIDGLALTTSRTSDRLAPAPLARIQDLIDRGLAAGLSVVLDLHRDPGLDGPPPAQPAAGQRLLAIWAQLAARLESYPPTLWFELYNEPHNGLTPTVWNPLSAQLVRLLRQSGHESRVVVIGPSPWNHAEGLPQLTLPPDPAIVVALHHYQPFSFTHQGASWMGPPLSDMQGELCCNPAQQTSALRPLQQAAAWAQAQGRPLWLGEFGSYAGPPGQAADIQARARWTALVRQEAERLGLAWCYWELEGGFGLMDASTGQWRAELLAALFTSTDARPRSLRPE